MTEYAIPLWIFVTLFLILPLVAVLILTVQRHRRRKSQRPGFDVTPTNDRSDQRHE